MGPVRWTMRSDTAVVVVERRLDPADAASVCTSLHDALSGSGVRSVICRGEGLADPDLATVDLLARIELTARREGCVVRVESPTPRLRELVALAGLEGCLALREPET